MKKLLLSAAIVPLFSFTAYAADLPNTKGPPPFAPPPPPEFSWTGLNIGVNGGYGGDEFAYPMSFAVIDPALAAPGTIPANASLSSGGFVAGGQIGYNYQFPASNIVAGIEADVDWTSIRGQLSLDAGPVAGETLSAQAGSHLEYFGTVRARLGYALGNLLPYVTGGFAYGETTSYYGLTATGPLAASLGGSESVGHDGWTAGAGLAYAITPNLTFKTEYLYVDLGTRTLFSGAIVPGVLTGSVQERTTLNVVRAGLDWHFDFFAPPAPVVAKY